MSDNDEMNGGDGLDRECDRRAVRIADELRLLVFDDGDLAAALKRVPREEALGVLGALVRELAVLGAAQQLRDFDLADDAEPEGEQGDRPDVVDDAGAAAVPDGAALGLHEPPKTRRRSAAIRSNESSACRTERDPSWLLTNFARRLDQRIRGKRSFTTIRPVRCEQARARDALRATPSFQEASWHMHRT